MRPYPTHPVPWPKIDLAPLVLVPEPEFVAPELEKLPVLRQPPLHSIPALPLSVQWEVLMRRRLGARPLFLLDISGSMCEADVLCACEGKGKCSWLSKVREAMLVALRDGGAVSGD